MKNLRLIPVLLMLTSSLRAQPLQTVSYAIHVRLDDKHRQLEGDWTMTYTNRSSDTLHYLWLQLWPNAYRNDHTAFSEHLLDIGINDFYFSDKDSKGYMNRLVFQCAGQVLVTEDDSLYIDVEKLLLAEPLPPGSSAVITSPFHVVLPRDFAGYGYSDRRFRISNWYPAVAPYTRDGWQQRPYTGKNNPVAAHYQATLEMPAKYSLLSNAVVHDSTVTDSIKSFHVSIEDASDLWWSAVASGAPALTKKQSFGERVAKAAPLVLSRKILPAIGYNVYDGLQLGILIHNFRMPENKLTYFAAPTYAFNSSTLTGNAGISYNFNTRRFNKLTAGLNGSRFSNDKGVDTLGKKVFGTVFKLAPYIRLHFHEHDRHVAESLELRTFIIGEKDLDYAQYSVDSFYYPVKGKERIRYLNQLTFRQTSYRSLYPYDWQLQLQQASGFYRINAEAHYLFNYADRGGLRVRLFAAKFGYLGMKDYAGNFRFQPKLTAVRGSEDYTYGNAFIGRDEYDGFASQQIMLRDGGLKIRTDNFQDLQGRSDNWIAAANFSTSLPSPLPKNFPLRIFLDVGTYADAWKRGTAQPRFLYVGGLQLSLLKNILNIYAPFFYSKSFSDNLKTVPEENGFLKKISFSIDIQRIDIRRITGNRITN